MKPNNTLLKVADRLDPNAAWKLIRSSQTFVDVPTVLARDSTWNTPQSDCTRIVCMSDTHGRHGEVSLPQGDILIHGGDFTSTGEVATMEDLAQFFRDIAFPHTICIAGNHDMSLHESFYDTNWARFHDKPEEAARGRTVLETLMKETASESSDAGPQFLFLEDTSCTVLTQSMNSRSLSIYGSPWTPEFYNWAFNLPRGQPSWDMWSKIPESTDILVTHGPPLGRGDLCTHGGRAGCYDLLYHVQERVQPRLHIFGQIHEGYGSCFDGTTLYINASNLDLEYDHVHPCIVIDLPHDSDQPARIVKPECHLSGNDFLKTIHGNYEVLSDALERSGFDEDDMPAGDALLESAAAYKAICNKIYISRAQQDHAYRELRVALSELYAKSF